MAEYTTYARKQLEREINHLKDQYDRLKKSKKKNNAGRLKELERKVRKHNPAMKINYDLLRLVGTEPYNPVSYDKELVRRIVAERYG
jgi:hypothetical protein